MKGAVRDSKGTWGEVCEGIEGRRFGVDKREREMCWISERDMRGGGDGGARVEGWWFMSPDDLPRSSSLRA